MPRCCRCGCTPINFRCFDPATGGVKWEDYLFDPLISTDGDVYSLIRTSEVTGTWTEINVNSNNVAKSFPARDSDQDTPCSILGVKHQDGDDGSITNTLTHYTIADNQDSWITGFPGVSRADQFSNYGGMEVSAWRVNSSGEIASVQGVPNTLYCLIEGLNDGGNTLTYHFRPWLIKDTAQLTLSATGDLATNDATFNVDDSKATIESAITSAFNALNTTVSSVTVSHFPIYDGPMSIEITWVDSSYYLDTVKPTYTSGSALLNGRGNCYAQSLITGEISGSNGKAKHSSSYLHDPIWDSDGNIFRIEADAFSPTTKELTSWDTSTDPWTEDWTDNSVFSKTPINEDEESSIWGIGLVKTAADNGWVAIGFAYTSALQDITVQRMSVLFYENDGSNETDVNGGWKPYGLCCKDDGTAGSPVWGNINVDWRDANWLEYADSVGQTINTDNRYNTQDHLITYDPTTGGSSTTGGTSLPTVSDTVNLADFSNEHVYGFDGTRAYFASTGLQVSTAQNQMSVGTRLSSSGNKILQHTCGQDDSDIIDPDTLVNIPMYTVRYTLAMDANTRAEATSEWRLAFERIEATTSTTYTRWFDDTDTISDLNTELATLFGSDKYTTPRQNVEATYDGGSATGGPLYEDLLYIDAQCATDPDDEFHSGFPALFTVEASGTPDELLNVYNECVQLVVEFRDADYERYRTNRIGAITLSTGADDWTRQFSDTSRDVITKNACLCRSNFFVLAERACSKLGTYITLTMEMSATGDAMSGWTVTITLTVANSGPNTVVVNSSDINVSVVPTSAPSWTPSSRTITSGNAATFTGTYATFASGLNTATGTVQGEDQTTADLITSNEATDNVTLS